MHPYFELVERSARIALHALKEAEDQVPHMGGTTAAVKTLQAIRLQKAIISVGMFSMLESILQDRLKSKNGFTEARRCLKGQKEVALEKRFCPVQRGHKCAEAWTRGKLRGTLEA